MKIFIVRIGDKYGVGYENYLVKKLSKYEVIWIRKPFDPRVKLQWNKLKVMSLKIKEPVCVIDIDILLINDYLKLFEHPINRGEFLSIPGWWRDDFGSFKINGGFYKYFPEDCNYIFDKFMTKPKFWQNYYILKKITKGPINGEQYFIEDSVNERLTLKLIPIAWVTRMASKEFIENNKDSELNRFFSHNFDKWIKFMNNKYTNLTGNKFFFRNEKFHNEIKLVHYTHHNNKPF